MLILYGGLFDPDEREKKIKELELITNEPNFWNDKNKSNEVISELNYLKNGLELTLKLKDRIETNLEMLNEMKDVVDLELKQLLEMELIELEEKLSDLEIQELLNGPYDKLGAIVEIHPGA